MDFNPYSQSQRHKFWAIIHPLLQRFSTIYHYPVQSTHDPLGRDIDVDFYRQSFGVKIVYHIEGTEASAAHQSIVQKSMD